MSVEDILRYLDSIVIIVYTNQKRCKFGEEEARESISANVNPPEVVERSLTESYKGTGGRIVIV